MLGLRSCGRDRRSGTRPLWWSCVGASTTTVASPLAVNQRIWHLQHQPVLDPLHLVVLGTRPWSSRGGMLVCDEILYKIPDMKFCSCYICVIVVIVHQHLLQFLPVIGSQNSD